MFDYNLLKVLRVLLETRNTKQAAERLNLSQSAVSHALSRLRETFDDALFVRERYGLVPTERCYELERRLPELVEQIDGLLALEAAFDPSKYQGKVSISLTNALTNAIGVDLFSTLREKAPNARFEIMDWRSQVESALLSRKIHVALDYGPEGYSKQIKQELMPKNHFMFCVRQGHPLTQLDVVTIHDLAKYPMVLIRTPDWQTRHETAEQSMLKAGHVPDILLKSDSPEVNFNAIRHSDAFFPVASVMTTLPDDIVAIHPTVNSSTGLPKQNMDVYAYYLYQTQDSPLINWLLSEIKLLLQHRFENNQRPT